MAHISNSSVTGGGGGGAPLRNELTQKGHERRRPSRSALYSCVTWLIYNELLFQQKKIDQLHKLALFPG